MGIHDGHRDHVRQRYLNAGLDAFADHEVLELLLFYAIPRRDTNEIAHLLMEEFSTLSGVLSAPMDALTRIPGMGEGAALYLRLLGDTARRMRLQEDSDPVILNSTAALGRFFLKRFRDVNREQFYMACLDAKGKLLKCICLSDGTTSTTEVSIRQITRNALLTEASAVVFAHNHPSGVALPSAEDVRSTRQAEIALQMIDVQLLDHLIFADGDFVSMRENGSIG